MLWPADVTKFGMFEPLFVKIRLEETRWICISVSSRSIGGRRGKAPTNEKILVNSRWNRGDVEGGIQSYEIKWLFRQAFNVHPRTWRLIYSSSAVRIDWARHGPERLRVSSPFGPGVAFSSSIHIKGLRFMAALCIPFEVSPCFQRSQAWVREQYHKSQFSLWQKDLKQ